MLNRKLTILGAVAACATLLAGAAAEAKTKQSKAAQSVAVPAAAPAALAAGDAAEASAARGFGHGHGGGDWMLRLFDVADSNGDGLLSKQEVTTYLSEAREKARADIEARFTEADTSADGQLSRAEVDAGLPMLSRHFDRIDADDDGQLTKAELADLRRHHGDAGELLSKLRTADTDGNGKLDLAEVQNSLPALAPRFSELDKDDDGYLTVEDLKQPRGP